LKHITLIITGSIAAPKALLLAKKLKKTSLVTIICTKSAWYFLENKDFPYYSKMFEKDLYRKDDMINHTNLALKTDLIVVYPATMSFISKAALAIADSLALATFLASPAPKILFPAMNHYMYHNEGFQKQKKALALQQNITIIDPDPGMLACKMLGDGRVKEPDIALAIISNLLTPSPNLTNKKVLINYGRTRSYLDPIRFITNNSSGKMGQTLVNAFLKANAQVIAVVGDLDFETIIQPNLTIIKANTNEKMLKAMNDHFNDAEIVLCVGALNDYQLSTVCQTKIAKNNNPTLNLTLIGNIDILSSLGKKKTHQILIGFTVQDKKDLNLGSKKMQQKNCDSICINDIKVMGDNATEIQFYFKTKMYHLNGSKTQVSTQIVTIIAQN